MSACATSFSPTMATVEKGQNALEAALELCAEQQLVARLDGFLSARCRCPQNRNASWRSDAMPVVTNARMPAVLRQRLDDHHARHHRTRRKVPGKNGSL